MSRFIRHYHQTDYVSLLEKTKTGMTILVGTMQDGGVQTNRWTPWVRWDVLTDDERSKQVVVRQVGRIEWED